MGIITDSRGGWMRDALGGGIISKHKTPFNVEDYDILPFAGPRFAKKVGYVVDGWKLTDYLKAAVDNQGFECAIIWGPPGTGKSNFGRQLLYSIYQDWEKVLDCTVTSVHELVELVNRENGTGSIPALLIDDISRTIPRQLWHQNQKLYMRISEALQVIRSIFNVILVTVPKMQFVPEPVLNMTTFDIHVTPSHIYTVERWMPMTSFRTRSHPYDKILVEVGRFQLRNEPYEVYKRYRDRRVRMAYEAIEGLRNALQEDAAKRGKQKTGPEMLSQGEETIYVALTCPKCKFFWNYKPRDGRAKPKVKCPNCHSFVRVPDPAPLMERKRRLMNLLYGENDDYSAF
ncbi:MAG: hypothetical protein QXQ70_03190 [Candidatus Caldarchaeum sp.]